MFKKLSCYITTIILLKTLPSHTETVLNTEKLILSFGDQKESTNEDLEIIKNNHEQSHLSEKLRKFHKFLNLLELTESPTQRQFFQTVQSENKYNFKPELNLNYPDSPYEISIDRKHLAMMERRLKIQKNKRKIRSREGVLKSVKKRRKKKRKLILWNEKFWDEDLKKQYFDYINSCVENDLAYKYSDEGKPEETFKEVLLKIMDIRIPKNCTNFKGFGIQAFECQIKNFNGGVIDKDDMLYNILQIIVIWSGLSLIILIPFWCIKGWCCCCCCCELCHPQETIFNVKDYIEQNPPGIIVNERDIEKYNPTKKEIELYESLRRLIQDV